MHIHDEKTANWPFATFKIMMHLTRYCGISFNPTVIIQVYSYTEVSTHSLQLIDTGGIA